MRQEYPEAVLPTYSSLTHSIDELETSRTKVEVVWDAWNGEEDNLYKEPQADQEPLTWWWGYLTSLISN